MFWIDCYPPLHQGGYKFLVANEIYVGYIKLDQTANLDKEEEAVKIVSYIMTEHILVLMFIKASVPVSLHVPLNPSNCLMFNNFLIPYSR